MTRNLLYLLAALFVIAAGLLLGRDLFLVERYVSVIIVFGMSCLGLIVLLAMHDHDHGERITLRHHELMVAQDRAAELRDPAIQARVDADRKARDV
jgi:hypothetical protein